ncbi:MAG: Gfo/Idh/MocA family oxidoreductase [Anaerolineae bacterium]|jgi:predicted dehydrogenase
MDEKLRVGIAGSGVGQAHIRAFQNLPDQFEVVVLCGTQEAKTRDIAAKYNIPRFSTNIGELYRMDDLDVIDLCTPSHQHVEQVQQALMAGKHIICEKPVAGSLREVDELIQAEAASDRRVMPIFQYRSGRGLQKLKFLIEEGVAGQAYLSTVETAWRRRADYYATWHGRWETELGGALVTLAVHAHDVLTYVIGPARRVLAHTATLVNPIETEDCVSASLEMADGSLASLSVTTGSAAQITRHRFCFSNLTAESNTEPYENTTDPWTFTGDSPEIEKRIEGTLSRFVPLPEDFEGQFYRFYAALKHGAELPVTLADARTSLELITAIYHSAQTGRVVEFPLGKDHPKYADWRPY